MSSLVSNDPDDRLFRLRVSSPPKSEVSKLDASPKTLEQIQANIRLEIQARKERNEANQKLAKFKKLLQKQEASGTAQNSVDKIALLPQNMLEDLNEAALYAYFAVRYVDAHIYTVIMSRTNKFAGDRNL